jgi:hypothetical protein
MEDLPYIDEHSVPVDAPPERVWAALVGMLGRSRAAAPLARALGCDPRELTPGFDGGAGQSLPGFRVVRSEPGRLLELRGRHRFSDYRLTFLVGDGCLRAQSHAAFPGLHGRLYRAAVIGTRAHRVLTRRLLHEVAARAAR